jgi:hypothetical protein
VAVFGDVEALLKHLVALGVVALELPVERHAQMRVPAARRRASRGAQRRAPGAYTRPLFGLT